MRGLKTRRLWKAVRSARAGLLYLMSDVGLTFVFFDTIPGYQKKEEKKERGVAGVKDRIKIRAT